MLMFIGRIEADSLKEFSEKLENKLQDFTNSTATLEMTISIKNNGSIAGEINLRGINGISQASNLEKMLEAALK